MTNNLISCYCKENSRIKTKTNFCLL